VVAGEVVQVDGNTATIRTPANQTRTVRVTPQTRLPRQRPQPGDRVLVIGRWRPDGAFVAQAVVVRAQRANAPV
jgi:hypothetical protein